ncbi:hypothetical protein [Leifsonia virtsii]|uniref:Uncharacterized protein n=1 Tax=Leifsonia virtsii TaxID=3035915 RepID=A0ABT8IZF9_9MICO|nr:hypothetical protein [Leifsonia virtsii]MDN4598211.1 hypothetical protein [Leifsonia virtsii]
MSEESPPVRVVSVTHLRRCPYRVREQLGNDERCAATRRGASSRVQADRVRVLPERPEDDR